jgi:endonuclease G
MSTEELKTKEELYNEQASQRFQMRQAEREERLKELRREGAPAAIESQERVDNRRELINPNDGVAWERVLGNSDLMAINFLEIGLRAAQAVCRIQVRDLFGRVQGYGTGFMVSPTLLLTNHHVLETLDSCRRSLAEFNFEDDETFVPKESKTFPLEPERFFFTNVNLDFTLVAVRPIATDGTSLSEFGHLRLRSESGKSLIGEFLTIVQHPNGSTKQVALRENKLIDILDYFVHYSTDTMPGSSGSPVFNDQWDVVALHHAGVQKRDRRGRVLAKNGRLWKPVMGEDEIAWIANEGVRISDIFELLAKQNWDAEQNRLIAELHQAGGAPVSAGPVEMIAIEQSLEWYAGSQGYATDFLGQRVELPRIPAPLKADIAPLKDGSGHELKYTNFSLVMNKARKLAFYTAVNIDGAQIQPLKRDADKWFFDPRIERDFQMGPEVYSKNDLDRGHLVRRLDPVWGSRAAEANDDTFHFTNCSPQHKNLNQKTWQGLEDYILKNADVHDLRVSVFTGPVFRNDDMLYRDRFQIPAEFWKVVVMVKADGKPSATAYLQTQKNLIIDLEFAFGEYKTYQVPVTRIEALTGLDFGKLRNFDPLANIEATLGRVIHMPQDIRL